MLPPARVSLSFVSARLKFNLIVLTLVTSLQLTPAQAQTATGGAITNAVGDTSTHSSTATVSGATGPVATVIVELEGVTSNGTGNYYSVQAAQWMLKAPSGQEIAFLGYTGDGTDGDDLQDAGSGLHGVNIIVQDGKTPAPWGGPPNTVWPATGTVTVAPSSYDGYPTGFTPALPGGPVPTAWPQYDGCNPDPQTYNSGCSAATLNGNLAGATADGTWTLYMNDNQGDPVSITGWSLTLTYSTATATTTTVTTTSSNPSFNPTRTSPTGTTTETSITFKATVSATSGTPTGTITFSSNGTTLCSAVALSAGTASCTTSLGTGYNSILAAYTANGSFANSSGSMTQLVEVAGYNASGNTWCNYSPLTIVGAGVPAAYPSIVNVSDSAYNGKTVGSVSLETFGVSTNALEGQYLLVAPGGGIYSLDFLDNAFNGASVSNANLTFSDSGISPYNTTPTNGGIYLPWDQNYSKQSPFQALQTPQIDLGIPAVPAAASINRPQPDGGTSAYTFEEAFNGAPANGEWSLYAYIEPVTISGGYCLTFNINPGTGTTTSVTSNSQLGITGSPVTITATVTSVGNPVTSGTVTFLDTTYNTTLASDVAVNGSGVATYTSSALTEGDHKITATYNGTTTYNTSFGYVWQRIDDAPTVSNVNSNTWQFCNTGKVEIPMATSGPYTPNPSNIFVRNLPGTLNTATLTLNNFSILVGDQLDTTATLVEGPTGTALDFFSNTAQGSGSDEATLGNYTFADSASSLVTVGNSNISPGTYKPTAYLNPITGTADVFTSSVSGFYNAPSSFGYAASKGSSTFASEFGSINANGTWSLFFSSSNANASGTGAANGWCVNLTENVPTVIVTEAHSGNFTQGQQNAPFTVVVDNNGTTGPTGDPTGTTPLIVSDTLNANFTYAGFSGTGWSCTAGTPLKCTNDSAIAQGSSYPTLTIDVNVANTALSGITNSVSVSGAGVAATNSNTDTFTIQPSPVLAVQKTHTGNFIQGQIAEWDINVSNTLAGSDTISAVHVSDTLPTGYTVYGFGTTSSNWVCSGTGTQTASCSNTQVVAGGSVFTTIEVDVNVPSNSPTSVSNTAMAWGGGDIVHTSLATAVSGTDSNVPVALPASKLAFGTAPAATITAGGNAGSAVTVQEENSSSGVVTTGSATITLTVTGPSSYSQQYTQAAVGGIATFNLSAASLTKSGTYTYTATSSPLTQAQATELINPATTASFLVSGLGTFTAPGIAGTLTVAAFDSYSNAATNFIGTVTLTSSDPQATLPVAYAFQAGDSGTHTFSVTLNTAGTQTMTATSGSATGAETGITVEDAVWALNANGTLVRLSSAGTQLVTGGTANGTATHGAVAFDNAGNVWYVDSTTSAVGEFNHLGSSIVITGSATAGVSAPVSLAIDGTGQAWVINGNNSVSVLNPTGLAVSPSTGYQGGNISSPTGITIDNAGSVWISNSGNNSVTKIFGAAAPVVAPTVTGTSNNTLGTRP